jgi:hypothetical protein
MSNQRHHFPSNTCTRQVMRNAYVDTTEIYKRIFGEMPNADVWPQAGGTCGDSYSGLVDENTATALSESRLHAI